MSWIFRILASSRSASLDRWGARIELKHCLSFRRSSCSVCHWRIIYALSEALTGVLLNNLMVSFLVAQQIISILMKKLLGSSSPSQPFIWSSTNTSFPSSGDRIILFLSKLLSHFPTSFSLVSSYYWVQVTQLAWAFIFSFLSLL